MQLENNTAIDLLLDWDSVFGEGASHETHADSIPDGLILSLSNLARVDIDYISDVTGEEPMTVINALKGSIFQNPDRWGEDLYKGWETAEEYLSGNLRRKLKSARKANKLYPGRFSDNIFALRKLLPDTVDSGDIYVTLGSPWVPTEVIEAFIAYMLKTARLKPIFVRHDEYTGTWDIPNKSMYANA